MKNSTLQTVNTTTALLNLLEQQGIPTQLLTHPECRTSTESRKARIDAGGLDVIGAKAIVMKVSLKWGNEFNVFVLPGSQKIDSQALKHHFFPDLKSFRFATPAELANLTGGLVPGSMPPFAQPIFPQLDSLYVAEALVQNYEHIGFNAGSLTHSLVISVADYLQAANPKEIFAFSL